MNFFNELWRYIRYVFTKPLLEMKLTIVLLMFGLMQVGAIGHAKNKPVMDNASLASVLSGKEQTTRVTGIVTNEKGEALPGVIVQASGEERRTTTNNDGRYTIEVAGSSSTLIFSYIGFEVQQVRVGDRSSIDIRLLPEETQLEELVVVGYGQQVSKLDLTGSVGTVNMDDLEKAPIGNLDQALQGRIAGVQLSSVDGQPGEEMTVVIRGGNSLTQDNSPLYVVDGFPEEEFQTSSLDPEEIESITVLKDASATAIYGARGANGVILIETKKGKVGAPMIDFNNMVGIQQVQKQLEMMSPYEFVKYQLEWNETAATRMYLRGGGQEVPLEYYKDVKPINWQDEVFRNAINRRHTLSVRGGHNQTIYSVSGALYNADGVILNTGYTRYSGRATITQKIGSKIDLNVNISLSGRNRFGGVVREADGSTLTSRFMGRVWGFRPVGTFGGVDLLEEDMDEEEVDQYDARLNPLVTQQNLYNPRYTNTVRTNGYVIYRINNSLSLRNTASLSTTTQKDEAFYNSKTSRGILINFLNTRGINATVSNGERVTWSNNTTLNFNKTYNSSHKVTGTAGIEAQESTWRSYGYGAQHIPRESLGMARISEGNAMSLSSTWRDYSLFSTFGRVDYSYNSKYIFTGTVRADASSKFSQANRWGVFPAAAVAWNMHREEWFTRQRVINTAKLRFSYGMNGNNRITEYTRFPVVTLPISSAYSWNNSTPTRGAVLNTLPNPGIKWETTENIDLGLELSFLKGFFDLEIDLYRKNTRDLLMNALVPTSSGFTRGMRNIGAVRNEGLEITLNSQNININKDLFWNTSFNISFNRNKVLALNGAEDAFFSTPSFISQYNTNPLYLAEVGRPAGLFYGYIWDGTYKYEDFDNPAEGVYVRKNNVTHNGQVNDVQPGDIKYRDLNGDLTIDQNDLTVIGRGLPIHSGGFNNNFVYKNFSMNVFFQWSYGNDIYNANRLTYEGNGNTRANLNQFASYADRWSPENPDSDMYRTRGQGEIGWHSSRVLEDGSYLRLKTVALNYNLPQNLIRPLQMKRATVGLSSQNLWTWTKYSGMDPEVSTMTGNLMPGFDYTAYPLPRTLVFTLRATF